MADMGRGSEHLRGKYKHLFEPRVFQREDIDRFVHLLEEFNIEFDDGFPLGKPDPEILFGRLRIKNDVFGKFLQTLIDLETVQIKEFDGFPIGVVELDSWLVNLELAPGRSR